MNIDKRYLVCALCWAVLGMVLGIYMAATGNHAELVTHAHILLAGFVVSFVYSVIHRLWLAAPARGLANLQFALHQLSAVIMAGGLFMLFANMATPPTLEPFLSVAALGLLLALLLMIYMVLRSGGTRSA